MWVRRPDARGILETPGVKKALPRYVDIVRKNKRAKYLIAKAVQAEYRRRDTTDELWVKHDALLSTFKEHVKTQDSSRKKPKQVTNSFLDLKVLLAHRLMQDCAFCERRCGVDRLRGEKGYCGAGRNFSLFSAFPHMGEEPELVPSGTIFTGGCSIRCIHCQNWDISQWRSSGTSVTPEMMALQVKDLAGKGCRNINMVGGDPTPMTWQWIETMNKVDINIATIWNSNSYYSEETRKLLAGFIDLYLLDFKYGNNECASEISDAPGYWEAATRNHLMAHEYGELLIRVLVLPGHNECCTRPILQWIHDNLGPDTRVNLMFQYRPEWRAGERPELKRELTSEEVAEARHIADEIGLRNLVR
ncbi:MAG: radical SAM protein [Candidatus Bathyarchaeota archaeon]|nr:radical SAM protein [Candidatus Bathyarchaeota archaeon]